MSFNSFLNNLNDAIAQAEIILICLQKSNDLDTTSSALALAKLIELNFHQQSKKKIKFIQLFLKTSVLGDVAKYDMPEIYRKDGFEEIDFNKAIFITVDVNARRQIYKEALRIAQFCKEVFQIDHHENSEELSKDECQLYEKRLILPEYSSCVEIIWKIAKELNWKVNKEIAEIIFFGIYAECRGLLSVDVNGNTFKTLGELTEAGAESHKIIKTLSTQNHLQLLLLADLLKTSVMYGNLGVFNLTSEIVHKYYPQNFLSTRDNRKIKQNKIITFPLNLLEGLLRVKTIFYIHYSLVSPFESIKKFLYVVLVEPNKEIEELLIKNDFIKHRNRYCKKNWKFTEITQFLEDHKKLLSS